MFELTFRGDDQQTSEQKIVEQLGDPKHLSQHYNDAINPHQRRSLLVYLGVIGILTTPLFILAFIGCVFLIASFFSPQDSSRIGLSFGLLLSSIALSQVLLLRNVTTTFIEFRPHWLKYTALLLIPIISIVLTSKNLYFFLRSAGIVQGM